LEYRDSVGFPEARRAQRITCDRPVRILSPHPLEGRTVNISATGLLVRMPKRETRLRVGDAISLNLLRVDGNAAMTISGNVVRIEDRDSETRLAVNLA
jgi:hypothetical protein